jgi:hypothetical protein
VYAAQEIPPIDAEIAEKGHLWTETSYNRKDSSNTLTPVSQYSNIPIAITSSFLDIQARPSNVD